MAINFKKYSDPEEWRLTYRRILRQRAQIFNKGRDRETVDDKIVKERESLRGAKTPGEVCGILRELESLYERKNKNQF